MVTIKIDTKTLELTAEGHANSAPMGEDLVCCAVSILLQTLCIWTEEQDKAGRLISLKEEIEPGHVYLNPQPYGWSRREILTAFCVIREGLKALAEQNENYIRMEGE